MIKPLKIVVFDLDETLGYFTEFGIFCDCLNNYFKKSNYSDQHFNELLDLYPLFLRPNSICFPPTLKAAITLSNNGLSSLESILDSKYIFILFAQLLPP